MKAIIETIGKGIFVLAVLTIIVFGLTSIFSTPCSTLGLSTPPAYELTIAHLESNATGFALTWTALVETSTPDLTELTNIAATQTDQASQLETAIVASTNTAVALADQPTPYSFILDGYFYCRAEPTMSSKNLVLIRGQQVTITAKHEGWLYVNVKGFAQPCWVSMTGIPNLDQDAISLVPTYNGTLITPTFTLPPGTQTNYVHGGGGGVGTPQPSFPTSILNPLPTDTPIPPPTFTNVPSGPRQCNDGIDNDGDGLIDYPADPGCKNKGDDSE